MTEIPLLPWWLTLGFAAWAAVGPVVGLLVGHFLTRSWEKKRWELDNRKQEAREILPALSAAYLALLNIGASRRVSGVIAGEEEKNAWLLTHDSFRALRDRIFLAHDLKGAKLLNRWTEAIKTFDHKNDLETLTKAYNAINDEIVALAMKR